MTVRRVRLVQLVGVLVAAVGLAGFWLSREAPRALLSEEVTALVNPQREAFQASFVVAGRDIGFRLPAQDPIYNAQGEIVGFRTPARGPYVGFNTDTVLFVNVTGDDVTMIAIPRDTWLPQLGRRINAVYAMSSEARAEHGFDPHSRAESLRLAVSDLLGVPVDYYVIVNLSIFQQAVDAVGGIELEVPQRMYWHDSAANMLIDLQPGLQRLDGERAAQFVRYRHMTGDDFARIDNLKRFAQAYLKRLRELHVRAVGTVPQLIDLLYAEVETNVPPALATRLLPRLSNLRLHGFTLPTHVVEGSGALRYDPVEVEAFLAGVFGGSAREMVTAPDATLVITNRSGEAGLAEAMKARLVQFGIDEERLVVREATEDGTPTRVLATAGALFDAYYYAEMLRVGWQQAYRLDLPRGMDARIELVLGRDAPRLLGDGALLLAGE